MIDLLIFSLVALSVLNPRLGLFALVCLLPFLPRYLGIGLGDEGFALTHRRALSVALLAGILVYALLDSSIVQRAVALTRAEKRLAVLVVGVFAVKILSTIAGSGIGSGLLYAFDDMILALVPALGALVFLRTARDERWLVSAIVAGLLITVVLAMLESASGSGLLHGVVDVSVEEARTSALEDRTRDGEYRAKALFDNPLLMSEFLCLAWPWAWYLMRTGRTLGLQALGTAALVVAPVGIYLSHTRSGVLVFAVGVTSLAFLRAWQRSDRETRLLIALAIAATGLVASRFAIELVADPRAFFAASEAAGRSAAERIEQFTVVATAWRESPLLGYGMTRNFAQDLEFLNRIDNYWLRLVLEGGVAAVGLFLAIVIYSVLIARREWLAAPHLEYRLFMTACVTSIISFAAYKMFLSMPMNNAYFFLFVTLLIRRTAWRRFLQHAGVNPTRAAAAPPIVST